MPLSENEQRQLEAIERALMADDRKFAQRVQSTDLRTHTRRRLVRAAVMFVVGTVLLALTAVNLACGIVGFVLMFTAVLSGAAALKRLRGHQDLPRFGGGGGGGSGPRRTPRPEGEGWRDRVEERWKRRWEERD